MPQITITHFHVAPSCTCIQSFTQNLERNLNVTMNIVKYIRRRTCDHIFRALYKEISAVHTVHLYHTEIWWVSKGCMLSRDFELMKEIMQFLSKQNFDLIKAFKKQEAILRLA